MCKGERGGYVLDRVSVKTSGGDVVDSQSWGLEHGERNRVEPES